MGVSKDTVNKIVAIMLAENKAEYTIDDLKHTTGYSTPTVRQAISVGRMQGHIHKVPGGYPAKFRAIKDAPQVGQTLIIKEAIPPMEIDRAMMAEIRNMIATVPNKQLSKQDRNKLPEMIAAVYKESPLDDRSRLKDFLINFAEVIKRDLEANQELDPSDLNIKTDKDKVKK